MAVGGAGISPLPSVDSGREPFIVILGWLVDHPGTLPPVDAAADVSYLGTGAALLFRSVVVILSIPEPTRDRWPRTVSNR